MTCSRSLSMWLVEFGLRSRTWNFRPHVLSPVASSLHSSSPLWTHSPGGQKNETFGLESVNPFQFKSLCLMNHWLEGALRNYLVIFLASSRTRCKLFWKKKKKTRQLFKFFFLIIPEQGKGPRECLSAWERKEELQGLCLAGRPLL